MENLANHNTNQPTKKPTLISSTYCFHHKTLTTIKDKK
jgi:hypothetical protein